MEKTKTQEGDEFSERILCRGRGREEPRLVPDFVMAVFGVVVVSGVFTTTEEGVIIERRGGCGKREGAGSSNLTELLGQHGA